MENIQFSTGLVTYKLNGQCEVAFNTTDISFAEKLFDVFDSLDQKQEAYKREVESAEVRQKFEIMRRFDAEMREMLDGIFTTPVCDPLFGKMNVTALSDGLPVWANLILAVMDTMEGSFAEEKRKTNPRLAKYTAKYKGK